MLVHEPRGGEPGLEPVPKIVVELLLVVVESELGGIVDGADVDDAVQVVEDFWVARPDDLRVLELGGLEEEVAAERLVAVEGAVVGSWKGGGFRMWSTGRSSSTTKEGAFMERAKRVLRRLPNVGALSSHNNHASILTDLGHLPFGHER